LTIERNPSGLRGHPPVFPKKGKGVANILQWLRESVSWEVGVKGVPPINDAEGAVNLG